MLILRVLVALVLLVLYVVQFMWSYAHKDDDSYGFTGQFAFILWMFNLTGLFFGAGFLVILAGAFVIEGEL